MLGAFEAGFAASLIFYLTTFYTRSELGKVSCLIQHVIIHFHFNFF